MQVQVATDPDLSLVVGNQSARLSPGQAFRIAEKLIRGATTRMVIEETDRATAEPGRDAR